jgi:hypothetical protein
MTSGTLTDHPSAADGSDTDTVPTPEPSSETTNGTNETDLSTDTLFELLKNRRRRDAIDYLAAGDGEATLSDMAERLAAQENGLSVEAINSKQRKRVYISLYQCHLPKMDRAGVIDFDKDRGTIALNEGARQLYPYLRASERGTGTGVDGPVEGAAERPSRRWETAQSSALAGVGIAGLAGVAGVPGFELLSPVGWAVVCAVSLLVVAARPVLGV